jgi:hypothetical protein
LLFSTTQQLSYNVIPPQERQIVTTHGQAGAHFVVPWLSYLSLIFLRRIQQQQSQQSQQTQQYYHPTQMQYYQQHYANAAQHQGAANPYASYTAPMQWNYGAYDSSMTAAVAAATANLNGTPAPRS